MKKYSISLGAALLMLSIIPVSLRAGTEPKTETIKTTDKVENAAAAASLARLYEIKAMDLKSMNAVQKKALRTEVHALKSNLKKEGGVYLSVGAIIIIALILILLF